MKLLNAHDLVKIYGRRRVVDHVSFEVDSGEIVGLLGPNGAGKTTSFAMTIGMVRPDGGRIEFKGEDATRLPIYRRARLGMGYLSQEPSIFRKLTVEENILAILETLALPRKKRMQRLEELLQELDLGRLRRSRAESLSGGERRRLEITRVLVTRPALILLDEPFSGVDPIAIAEVQDIVRDLRDRGIGVLLTDHNVRETLSITDRSYIIAEGRIIKQGSADELIQDPTVRKVYLGDRFSMPETGLRSDLPGLSEEIASISFGEDTSRRPDADPGLSDDEMGLLEGREQESRKTRPKPRPQRRPGRRPRD
jgi:lipopolysaccharide export system ATP-binding protein